MSSKDLAIQLADKVVGNVRKAGVREDILETLLQAVENNVREATTEALLVIYGAATVERDKSWVQQLQGEWSPKSGLRTATTPAEVEAEIRAWMAARIQETRAGAYAAGYEDGFRIGIEKAIKLGWGSCEAGKSLEETVKVGEKLKPR